MFEVKGAALGQCNEGPRSFVLEQQSIKFFLSDVYSFKKPSLIDIHAERNFCTFLALHFLIQLMPTFAVKIGILRTWLAKTSQMERPIKFVCK